MEKEFIYFVKDNHVEKVGTRFKELFEMKKKLLLRLGYVETELTDIEE
jgi:hypothetical protein